MKFEDKISILKKHQVYCYQVCLSLLHEQHRSEEAACVALLDLAQHPDFFSSDHNKQRAIIRQAAMKATKKIELPIRTTA